MAKIAGGTWHQKFNWKAEDYFDDAHVIALCHAIEKNDIAEIDRLVAAGANVNAQGKGKMTPLLWAFPDNKLDRFKRLLEHGADPNVLIESDFGTRDAMMPGVAVTHMAIMTSFPGYFDAVFAHGGDPNLEQRTRTLGRGDTPIFLVIESGARDKQARIRQLLAMGVDIDKPSGTGNTPAMWAVAWFEQFDLARMLLETGADHQLFRGTTNSRLVHDVLRQRRKKNKSASWSRQQWSDYQAVIKWLEAHGESVRDAEADLDRWQSWSPEEYPEKMKAEIAERKATEAQAKKAAPAPEDKADQK